MQPIVNGATRLLFIVGDPIAQVRSPLVYNPKIEAHGKNCILVPLLVPQQDFEQTIPAIMRLGNLEGLIITFPFKERIMPFIRHISPDATLIGAVNAVKLNAHGEWCGDIFDGIGMIRAVQALGQTVNGRKALLYGAGGAGKAIAAALLSNGADTLTIIDHDHAKAAAIAAVLKQHYPNASIGCDNRNVQDHDLLINATPVGMGPNDSHVEWTGTLHAGITVVDIVPYPIETPLLALAKQLGCPNTNGQAMIQGQSDAVLDYFNIG
ncbi:MAG: shikimate dehydrogenase [Rhizobiales bacterium]|nr:shikimate dehydrogenase [Hyphomicrobiales bacterium]